MINHLIVKNFKDKIMESKKVVVKILKIVLFLTIEVSLIWKETMNKL